MRTPFVAGNWKMNTSRVTGVELAAAVSRGAPPGVVVGVAPPFVYLEAVGRTIAKSEVLLGAQDVYPGKSGAFTGEICIEMLLDMGVKFCLAGHSERRHVIHESAELIAAKAAAIYAGGLILVHCVGETIQERQAGKALDVVRGHVEELSGKIDDPSRLVIAYEPVWAIGTGLNATEAQAQEVHAYIRGLLAQKWNGEFAQGVRIQYGGSLKADNAAGLMAQADVDGGLVGGAALKAESFLAIASAAATAAGRKSQAERSIHV